MIKPTLVLLLMISLFSLQGFKTLTTEKSGLYPALTEEIVLAKKEFSAIPDERKEQLKKIALYIKQQLKAENKVNLVYICTHNSGLSFMSQFWAVAASEYYGIKGVNTFSGGLVVTAFGLNSIHALRNQGFSIVQVAGTTNPVYESRCSEGIAPFLSFSKLFTDPSVPKTGFAAVLTCSDAVKNCPNVPGASLRVSVPYEDPKDFNGKPEQDQVYKERCRQIAVETLYTFSLVNSLPR